jgi:hypothetical protein
VRYAIYSHRARRAGWGSPIGRFDGVVFCASFSCDFGPPRLVYFSVGRALGGADG